MLSCARDVPLRAAPLPDYHAGVLTESGLTMARQHRKYRTRHGNLQFGERCLIMGILNVTPDSFSGGGQHLEAPAAADRAKLMEAQGADVIDIGGESTRPGSQPVDDDEQMRRVLPVIQTARASGVSVPISIDTRSARVAEAALAAGADIVNDISGARYDRDMPGLLAAQRAPFVIMHMQGTPHTMQRSPQYVDVVREVEVFFTERAESLAAAGVDVFNLMIVDPGIGFGKNCEHNLALLRAAGSFGSRWPVLVGPSRKRFLGELVDAPGPEQRLIGTAATVAHAALSGVDMVRVHDVGEMRQVVDVCHRLAESSH